MKIKMNITTSAFEVNTLPKVFSNIFPSSLVGQKIPSITYDMEVDCSTSEFIGCFNAYTSFVKELASPSTVSTPKPFLPQDEVLDNAIAEAYDKYKF